MWEAQPVKCGLFRTDGTLLEKWEIPTRVEDGGKNIIGDIGAALLEKMEKKLNREDLGRDRDGNPAGRSEWCGAGSGESSLGQKGSACRTGRTDRASGGPAMMPMWQLLARCGKAAAPEQRI